MCTWTCPISWWAPLPLFCRMLYSAAPVAMASFLATGYWVISLSSSPGAIERDWKLRGADIPGAQSGTHQGYPSTSRRGAWGSRAVNGPRIGRLATLLGWDGVQGR